MSAETPTPTIYTALAAAITDMGPVRKDAKNDHFKSRYATLAGVVDVIEGPLADHGLLTIQTTEMHSHSATLPAVPVLVTRVIHAATGEQIASTYPILAKDPADPQKLAAALTYARRYSLLSVFGLTPEDDDGNTAARPASRPQTAPQPDAQPQAARSAPARAQTPMPQRTVRTAANVAAMVGTGEETPAERARRYTTAIRGWRMAGLLTGPEVAEEVNDLFAVPLADLTAGQVEMLHGSLAVRVRERQAQQGAIA